MLFLATAPLLGSALCNDFTPLQLGLVAFRLVSLAFVLFRAVSSHCWAESIFWLCIVSCDAKHIRRQLLTEIMETCFLFVPVAK